MMMGDGLMGGATAEDMGVVIQLTKWTMQE